MNDVDRFGIPAELRERKQWLLWRRERRRGKATKVPYQANGPRVRASTTDARTWGAFDRAVAALEKGGCDGIGFVFAEGDPFAGVDLDGCRDERGELNATATAIVERLDSYSELSPSGSGLHVIVRARLEGGRCRRGPVEIYDRGRYFAMTGNRLPGVPHAPMPRQPQLDELCARLFPPADTASPTPTAVVIPADEELLRRAFRAKNRVDVERLYRGDTTGYGSHSEADLALVAHLAFWCRGDRDRIDRLFRRSGLMRDKWLRGDYRERTISAALR